MTALVKIHRKGKITLPNRLRSAIGVAEGDVIEASVHRGKIVLTPKPIVDRSKIPNAEDECTPAQRRVINRGIAQSEKEYKQGRHFGPFESHKDFLLALHNEAKKVGTPKTKHKTR